MIYTKSELIHASQRGPRLIAFSLKDFPVLPQQQGEFSAACVCQRGLEYSTQSINTKSFPLATLTVGAPNINEGTFIFGVQSCWYLIQETSSTTQCIPMIFLLLHLAALPWPVLVKLKLETRAKGQTYSERGLRKTASVPKKSISPCTSLPCTSRGSMPKIFRAQKLLRMPESGQLNGYSNLKRSQHHTYLASSWALLSLFSKLKSPLVW